MNPKMKQFLTDTIKLVAFLLLFAFVLSLVQYILIPKANDTQNLYSLDNLSPNSVDVILVGSSHVQSTIQPAQLFGEFGIASVNVATPAQSIANSYYLTKYVMETQNPKLVVLDLFALALSDISFGEIRDHQAMDAMRLSPSKIEAAFAIAEDNWLDFLFPLQHYHTRWKELNRTDFQPMTLHASYSFRNHTEAFPDPMVLLEEEDTAPIPEISLEYLKKIITLCRETDTKLLLTVIPYRADVNNTIPSYTGVNAVDVDWRFQQQVFHSAALLAEEENVDFLNTLHCLEEVDLDFMTDMVEWSHLNYLGAEKVTRFYGNYIRNHYDLPDRTEDPDYGQWHQDYQYYLADLQWLKNTAQLGEPNE